MRNETTPLKVRANGSRSEGQGDPSLAAFLAPSGIAVVGASHDPDKLGYVLARNLVQSGFPGAIHFVNPRGGTILGRPVYASPEDVPDPVDLAVVLVPAPLVPETLEACGRRGIRAVVVASGGFRETGAEGAGLEARCREVAAAYGLRFVGPNCVGILDTHVPFDTTFLPPPGPTPGDIAFLSHSGAICAVVIDWARGQGFGLSLLVSLGNQADVTEADLLEPAAADPKTRVLTLYLEGVQDGPRFVETAARVSRRKPVVALKVGRFAGGRQAAASHTGALAGREAAYDAAFRRAGVLRAATSEDLFDWARALAWCPLPAGRQVAILTNAGGPGVTAADAVEAEGLCLASLAPGTREALRAVLPPPASLANPVDMLAAATPDQYAASLRLLLADDQVQSVLVILPPPPASSAGAVARALIPVVHGTDKPVVVALMGDRLIREAAEHLRAARVPDYRFPERAAAALAALARRAEILARPDEPPVRFDDVDAAGAQGVVRTVLPEGDGWLPPLDALRLVQAYGIPALRLEQARRPEQAVARARQVGFPVALKAASPDLSHKSDAGGVLLGLGDAGAVAHGYDTLLQRVRSARPDAALHGVYVQPMAPEGEEVIIGAVRDPQFGPLVMFGSGGIEVEGLHDVAFALAPLTPSDAAYLLEATWAGRRLNGFRGRPPADRSAVLDTLFRVGQLIADVPAVTALDLNPLRVLPAGRGVVAIDLRIRVTNAA